MLVRCKFLIHSTHYKHFQTTQVLKLSLVNCSNNNKYFKDLIIFNILKFNHNILTYSLIN